MKVVKGKDLVLSEETISRLLLEKHLLSEIIGLTPDKLTLLYNFASELYEQHKYQDAADVLYLLVILNPTDFNFWQSFGIASFKINDLEAAFTAYETAISLNPDIPHTYLYLQEVLIHMEDLEDAKAINHFLKTSYFDWNPKELAVIKESSDNLLNIK